MFTLYKTTFYLKFPSLTFKVERNQNKIDNMKIIIKSYLKRYFKNKQKIRRGKGVPKVPLLKELRASRRSYLITNSVRKIKSTTCLHLKSPLRKRGVERAKLNLKTILSKIIFLIRNSIWI